MNKIKSKTLKLALGGIAIFSFGIFVGYQLNFGTISSIQGFLFNAAGEASDANASDSNASSSNASSSNASDSNASDSNASSSNASSSNASGANYQSTDNIIYLQSFHLTTTTATAGGNVNVTFVTSGACLNGMTLTFYNQSNGTTFTTSVKSINDNPYVVLPDNLSTASYIVSNVLLVGLNSDNTTFTKNYNLQGDASYLDYHDVVAVTAKEVVTPLKLNSISIDSTSAKVGDKVNVTFNANENLQSLKLVFKSSDNKEMTVYVKSLTGKSYFEIPATTTGATYSLVSATLVSSKSTVIYTNDGSNGTTKFSFSSNIEVSDGTENVYVYNNEDITDDIITKLYNASAGTDITINADTNSLIDEELFNAIKGKNKNLVINYNDNQLVFNGKDITDSKTIDVNIAISKITSSSDIGKLVNDGIVVNFADNGNLPGKATVRIKSTTETDSVLGNKKIYVYFYNEDSNDFCIIASNVSKTDDGYYEFTISHNSDYILVNEKLDSKLVVSDSDSNVVSFQKSNTMYLLLIGAGVLVIAAVVVVIIVLKKKNKNKTISNN